MPVSTDIFPSMLWCNRLGGPQIAVAHQSLFDVKFWPWSDPEDEAFIFAVTGGQDIFVCRTKLHANPPFEIIRWWREDESYSLNSICWTKDANGKPLLCAAGSAPKSILIYDIESDKPVRRLPGHGRAINDLQISPASPYILASASEDYSIRVWNMSPKYEKQPCVAILAGQGHKQPLLALDFHPNGRWLLSGGMDTALALWAIPPLSELNDPGTRDQEPRLISYPCFISEEIHTNYVDSLKWYGDMIISRAARGQSVKGVKNEILLWKIDGFDSSAPAPVKPPIPYPGAYTRSAFPHAASSRGFQRLLTFQADHTSRFYLRFGFLHEPLMRPLLVMGNDKSKLLFWDLQRSEEGEDPAESARSGRGGRGGRGRGRGGINTENLDRLGGLKRKPSVDSSDGMGAFHTNRSSTSFSNTPNATTVPPSATASNTPGHAEAKRSLTDDEIKPLRPHCERVANTALSLNKHFATNQLSWSRDGRWLVGVGDNGMMSISYRSEAA